uniref:C-type lectin domain-containing protein n=1 Tax=Anolis carolinensis TaxID=28377 RepID=A0A803T3N0_ANOCA
MAIIKSNFVFFSRYPSASLHLFTKSSLFPPLLLFVSLAFWIYSPSLALQSLIPSSSPPFHVLAIINLAATKQYWQISSSSALIHLLDKPNKHISCHIFAPKGILQSPAGLLCGLKLVQDKPRSTHAFCLPGSGCWTWKAGLAVLTATLLLLVLLATAVGLGLRYWQVSGQLRRALQVHADLSIAQEGSLAQMEVRLHRATEELNSTRETLRRSQEEAQRTRERLQEALEEANHTREDLKQKEEELQRATSCQQAGCCPSGWSLFRWRCLLVSKQEKNWENSQKECQRMGSRLLVLKEPTEATALPEAEIPLSEQQYWIGLKKEPDTWRFKVPWAWTDNSPFSWDLGQCGNSGNCGQLGQGSLLQCNCGWKSRYICEQPARPMQVAQAP